MKKLTTMCLIMFAALSIGCSTSKMRVADSAEAGTAPTPVTQSPAAGASGAAKENADNRFRKLRFQSLRYRHTHKETSENRGQ